MNTYLLFPEGKEKALTLSYDDAIGTDLILIKLLEKFNIKCTFNINCGLLDPKGSVKPKDQVFFRLTEDDLKKYYDNPLCEVATHGFTHPYLEKLTTPQCIVEILKDRQTLENLFGKIVRGHAYPYGTYNEDVVNVLKNLGISYARTVESHHSFKLPTDWLKMGTTCHHNDPMLMSLADDFINGNVGEGDGWLFYLWGHTFEFAQNNNWDVIEKFFNKVANNNNVWYATNIEIYDYITAYRNLVYSVDGNMIYNPTSTDIWIKINGKKINILAGKTFKIQGERYERI